MPNNELLNISLKTSCQPNPQVTAKSQANQQNVLHSLLSIEIQSINPRENFISISTRIPGYFMHKFLIYHLTTTYKYDLFPPLPE